MRRGICLDVRDWSLSGKKTVRDFVSETEKRSRTYLHFFFQLDPFVRSFHDCPSQEDRAVILREKKTRKTLQVIHSMFPDPLPSEDKDGSWKRRRDDLGEG